MADRDAKKRESIKSMRKNDSQKGFEESIVLNNQSSLANSGIQSNSNLSELVSSTEFRVKKCENSGNNENGSYVNGQKHAVGDESSQIFRSSSNKSMHNFYKTRMKHSLIVSFLILIPVQNFFLCIVSQFSETDRTQQILESITFILVSIVSLILAFYLTRNESKFQKYPLSFSLIIYILINLNHIVPLIRSKTRQLATIEYGPFAILNIIAIYSILPLKKRYTILLSSLISIENIFLLTYFLYNSKFEYTIIFKKLSCYGIVYFMTNIFGVYHQILTSKSQDDAYRNTIKFLNGRMKLEKEKQQQEMLMVSVLPAHIALEMKSEMLRKTRQAQFKSMVINEDLNSGQKKIKNIIKACSFVDLAARRISGSAKNGPNNHENSARNSKNDLEANRKMSGKNVIVVDKNRHKASAFHDLHIKSHNNVSILYADIVNFTPLADKFEPPELVNILNKLFAKFDQKAKEYDCMRIKILGDCYYCVSGLPIPRQNHADNCVKMGLEMIEIIREVRDATGVDVDMRIGVHTGKVLCGVLGLRKWQYDVWSDDVTIANHMESAGIPGSVHISHETYANLTGDYKMEEGHGKKRDSLLREKNIVTYLIKPDDFDNSVKFMNSGYDSVKRSKYSKLELWLNDNAIDNNSSKIKLSHDGSTEQSNIILTLLEDTLSPLKCSFNSKCLCRPNQNFEFNPVTLRFKTNYCQRHRNTSKNRIFPCFSRQSLINTNSSSKNQIKNTTSYSNINGVNAARHSDHVIDDLNSACIACLAQNTKYRSIVKSIELIYSQQPLKDFKYFVAMCGLIFLSIALILFISDLKKTSVYYFFVGIGSGIYLIALILSVIKSSKYRGSHIMKSFSIMSKSTFLQYIFSVTTILLCLALPWTVVWTPKFGNQQISANQLALSALGSTKSTYISHDSNLIDILPSTSTGYRIVGEFSTLINSKFDRSFKTGTTAVLKPWTELQFDYSISCKTAITPQLGYHFFELNLLLFNLSILSCCSFIQLYFYSKLAMMLIGILIYIIGFNTQEIYECLGQSIHSVQPLLKIELLIQMIFYVIFLHLVDRRVELNSRLNFLWRLKFQREIDEVEVTSTMSRLLLENMLPKHVVGIILDPKRKKDEVYHEKYECVAVMFASIPNFKEFYVQSDINKDGLECLRLLNEIIAEFDLLLSKNKYSCVEKIKTIGSTYMAAAGLNIGADKNLTNVKERTNHYLIALTDFAFSMMQIIQSINKDCFNDFQLKIGINIGPVVAGVIGASKPQYDIWGNTVNVASRMESTGVMSRIQVPEQPKQILEEYGYPCDCRGKIFVKGKGEMVTYVVKPKNDLY
ncbi:adenylate cyclase type 2 [Brachionus plicatilis]|uniref:adenylate cyclase n=1 Tax=Brachionus plicatilis TaxID=10195 RepID=A0A3M7SY35_BRAPC|nr:adenylate cyclase type 2 [Brachionus plicatilis]